MSLDSNSFTASQFKLSHYPSFVDWYIGGLYSASDKKCFDNNYLFGSLTQCGYATPTGDGIC